jgi:UDP-glucuronate 4-epimerase
MKILITGVAGFIGTNTALNLLNKKHTIIGLDNFDDFNSTKLKKFRLNTLKKFKNFYFKKINIVNKKSLINFVSLNKVDIIIHLAGQAGVRYSYINPSKYINSNVIGFLNVIFAAKKNKIKKILYASSSSVYGNNNKFPLKEEQKLNQINIYAVSKMLNEKIAETYSKISKIKFIGLRFFTIYGEYGRPDMFLFKMFKSSITRKNFYLNNHGNHERDFTYVKDVALILEKLLTKKLNKNTIFNVCSNNPQSILKITNLFQKKNNLKVKQIEKHKADILKTHGDNTKIKKITGFNNFSKFRDNIFKLYEWYKQNKIDKL